MLKNLSVDEFIEYTKVELIRYDETIRARAIQLLTARQKFLKQSNYSMLRSNTQVKTRMTNLCKEKRKWVNPDKLETKSNKNKRLEIIEYMKREKEPTDDSKDEPTDSTDGFDVVAAGAGDHIPEEDDMAVLFCDENLAKIAELEKQIEFLKLDLQRAKASSTDTVSYDDEDASLREENASLREENASFLQQMTDLNEKIKNYPALVQAVNKLKVASKRLQKNKPKVVKDCRPEQRAIWDQRQEKYQTLRMP